MRDFWSGAYRFQKWVDIERAYIRFFLSRKYLDSDVVRDIVDKLQVSPYEVLSNSYDRESEFESFKEVIISKSSAFHKACFKNGFTYSNFVDISNVLLIRDWVNSFLNSLDNFREVLKKKAFDYKELIQIGRTHGMHAEPTSFGHKFANLYSDLQKYIDFIFESRNNLECVYIDWYQINDPSLAIDIQNFVASELNLRSFFVNSPHCARWKYIDFLSNLNAISQLISKLAFDLLNLDFDMVAEVSFSNESISSLKEVAVNAKLVDASYESFVSLCNSFELSGNSDWFKVEEKYLSESMRATQNIVVDMQKVLLNMEVNFDRIDQNLHDFSIYSQMYMLYLLRKTNYDRSIILPDVLAFIDESRSLNLSLNSILLNSPKYGKYFTANDLSKLSDPRGFFNNIDEIYERIFFPYGSSKLVKQKKWLGSEIDFYIDKLASELNHEYFSEKFSVSIVSFSERSLVFLGRLLTKLNFPVTLNVFPLPDDDLEIGDIEMDESQIRAKRVLLIDYFIDSPKLLNKFREFLRQKIVFRDLKVCTLLKFNDLPESENCNVDFYAIECPFNHFYAGFGKKGEGTNELGENLPYIGLTI